MFLCFRSFNFISYERSYHLKRMLNLYFFTKCYDFERFYLVLLVLFFLQLVVDSHSNALLFSIIKKLLISNFFFLYSFYSIAKFFSKNNISLCIYRENHIINGGREGIRTPGLAQTKHTLSKRALSTTQTPFHHFYYMNKL